LAEKKYGVKEKTKRSYLQFDFNSSFFIGIEFLASSIDKSLFIQQEKLYNAFKSLDINNNGSISLEELKNILG